MSYPSVGNQGRTNAGQAPKRRVKSFANGNRNRGPSPLSATVHSAPQIHRSARSGATVASAASDESTEDAAVQQLAYLVLSLRDDLKEATAARDRAEARVEELEGGTGAGGRSAAPSGRTAARLEQENAGLRADVDAFIAEQDDLKKETGRIKKENARLKRSAAAASSLTDLASVQEQLAEKDDAVAVLEDELDDMDKQVKELQAECTASQQQANQAERFKVVLTERNAKISGEVDELKTRIKVMIMQKKVQGEEIQTFKQLKRIADEDHEETLLVKQEHRQELDDLTVRLEALREKSQLTISELEQENYRLTASNKMLEEELEERSDTVTMQREAMTEIEESKNGSKQKMKKLRSGLAERDASIWTMEATQAQLQTEHGMNMETISALQKMIAALERSKADQEEELNQSSLEISELKDRVRTLREGDDTSVQARLAEAREENVRLADRVAELHRSRPRSSSASPGAIEAAASASRALVSSAPVSECHALISGLKSQIDHIAAARDAALEESFFLREERDGWSLDDSSFTTEPPRNEALPAVSPAALPGPSQAGAAAPVGPHLEKKVSALSDRGDFTCYTDADKASADEEAVGEERLTVKTVERSTSAVSLAPSVKTFKTSKTSKTSKTAQSRGSMLEAAKKIFDNLDQKRSREGQEDKTNLAKNSSAARSFAVSTTSLTVEDLEDWSPDADREDDSKSAKEGKQERPAPRQAPLSAVELAKDSLRSSGGRLKFDIDELTNIYFKKCGNSVSMFSDLSSGSGMIRRHSSPSKEPVTKKVKIYHNGVFMGTYEGDLNPEGQRHGFGVLLCDNSNSYEGGWKRDKRDGAGIARYSSGDVYDGQWYRGKRQGHGVMYIEAGDTYIGSWRNGLKHGAGTYHWADGEVDVSWYQEDRRAGEGVRWNSGRSRAYRLIKGTRKDELSLDEAYTSTENLGLNLEMLDEKR